MSRGVEERIHHLGERRGVEPDLFRKKNLFRQEIISSSYKKEKQVMIDVDNTIFPLLRGLKHIEPSLQSMTLSDNRDILRNQLMKYGFDAESLFQRLYHDPKAMTSVGPFRGAAAMMRVFKDHGLSLHIVSGRPESSREALVDFLRENNIPYSHLSLGVSDKLAYLQEYEITTLVDDNPELIQAAEAEGRDAISFDWQHAERALREHGGQEARDWEEIGDHVLLAVATNIKRRDRRLAEDPESLYTQAHDMDLMLQASRAGHDGTCIRRRVGAVIVNADGVLVYEGSNQAPAGAPSCEEDGCLVDDSGRCQRTVHAEASAILGASAGSLAGSTLYCTDRPCLGCAKLIAASGIRRVVYARPYHAESFEVDALFASVGVEVVEIAAVHEELNLPPNGPREGMSKPDEQTILN